MYRPYTITFLTHEAGHLLLSLHYQETSTSFYPQEHHVIFWALGFSGWHHVGKKSSFISPEKKISKSTTAEYQPGRGSCPNLGTTPQTLCFVLLLSQNSQKERKNPHFLLSMEGQYFKHCCRDTPHNKCRCSRAVRSWASSPVKLTEKWHLPVSKDCPLLFRSCFSILSCMRNPNLWPHEAWRAPANYHVPQCPLNTRLIYCHDWAWSQGTPCDSSLTGLALCFPFFFLNLLFDSVSY